MLRSNQVIMQDFLDNIVRIVSEGSSDKYVLMVLHKFVDGHIGVFPFLKYVSIDLKKIKVDRKINLIDHKLVGKFLKILVHSLFSQLFFLLVKRKIPVELAKDLEVLGIDA